METINGTCQIMWPITWKTKAILAERISVNAFGELNPVALNKRDDGGDNPQGRTYNRRVGMVMINVPQELVAFGLNDVPKTLLQR